MTLSIIAALGKNNEIGKGNNLLCYLPTDLKYFKEITLRHTVVMGRKTFESLLKGILPDRRNIIISRNRNLIIENAEVYTLENALSKLLKIPSLEDTEEIFIIGGAQVYQQTLPIVSKLYLTKIDTIFPEANMFFPPINYSEWYEISCETHFADTKNPYSFTFVKYERLIN